MSTGLKYVGPTRTDIPSIGHKAPGVRSSSGDPLYRWRRYYSKRGQTVVNVVVVSDSIFFGQGAAVGSPPNFFGWAQTMPVMLQRMLNGEPAQYYGTRSETGVEGTFAAYKANNGFYLPSHVAIGGVPSPWRVISGSLTQVSRGRGGAASQMNASTRIGVTAESATGCYLFYENGASNLGTPNLSVYAGDYASTRTATYVDNFPVTMNTGLAQYTRSTLAVALPSRGKYTFEVGINTGTPVIDGVYILDQDLRYGVRVYNWGLSGTSAFTYSANNTQANTAATSIGAIPDGDVDLLIIYLGAADYSVQNGTSTPAMFTSNLQAIVDKYRAAQTKAMPVLLVSHFARYDVTPSTYAWSLFESAMRSVINTRSDVDHLMLSPYFPTSQAADTDDDLVDSSGVHLTEGGQAVAAQAIAQKLMTDWALV